MRSIAGLIARIPFYQFWRSFGWPKILPFNYTFLISTQCNSRCKTCKIWKQKHDDLSLEEWKKIFESLGTSPFWVTISGGEPFLQKHLVEMTIALDKICQPRIINIPTNGLLGKKIVRETKKILQKVKEPRLAVNLSLDGLGKRHDRIRGGRGNFEKSMETYRGLKRLQKRFPNLSVGLGTVISKYNLDHFEELVEFIFKLKPDSYVTEIAEERVELGTIGAGFTPSREEYVKAVGYLIEKMKKEPFSGWGRLSGAFRLEYYQFVLDWLGGEGLLADGAGFVSGQITSWGEVWPSCIKGEEMGNLKKTSYDLRRVWFSKRADKIRAKIKEKGTSYPLANAFYSSALCHGPTLIRVSRRFVFGK